MVPGGPVTVSNNLNDSGASQGARELEEKEAGAESGLSKDHTVNRHARSLPRQNETVNRTT